MIIKKLAVPFINEKLLQQVEHGYIATAALSEAGFDFIRSRIPTKTKLDIVTGLDVPTSPEVLRRIWRNYQGRIILSIYTKNVFHANLYLFDLPFRKSVAFIGSGACTLEGIKDGEELFYKITDAKEIENLKSWFIGYHEFSEPLTEALIQEYEWRYPVFKQREMLSRQEKKQFIGLTSAGFNWQNINLKYQYFKKEDYLALASDKAPFTTPEISAARASVQAKFVQLHELIKQHVTGLKLHPHADATRVVSSLDPANHPDRQLRSLRLTYGRSESELKKSSETALLTDVPHLEVSIHQKEVGIALVVGTPHTSKAERDHFRIKMNDADYRKNFFALLTSLGAGYVIEIAADRKNIDTFPDEERLWEFTKADHSLYYSFLIEKRYLPIDPGLGSERIAATITTEFDKLVLIYRQMEDPAI
jgi:hypothetical protein